MPNVVVYVHVEDARRIAAEGRNVKEHVREIVRRALAQEREQKPPAPLPGQTQIPVDGDHLADVQEQMADKALGRSVTPDPKVKK